MTAGRGSRLAWLLGGANATLTAAGLILLALTLDHPPQGGWGFRGFPAIFALTAGLVGWLIMTRRPDNRVGLVLTIVGVLNGAQLFLTEYAAAGTRSVLPASEAAASVNAFIWVPTLGLMAGGIAFLFPDGHLPSGRWRPAAWLLAGGAVALIGCIAAYPSALDTPRLAPRLLALPVADSALNVAAYVSLTVMSAGIVAGAASLVLRWRRARGAERQQLKWLALAVALVVATMGLSVAGNPLLAAVFIAAIGTIPVAVGIAVLRYRLYEIDAVISRTIVYGALTAVLTGAFAALQRLLQAVFVTATGNESDAAIVITTLVLATSFAPLKRGIERLVDRRFTDASTGPAVEAPAGDGAAIAAAVISDRAAVAVELEGMVRRVVREELRDALGASRETPSAAGPFG
jgi:hypothetical protein